MSILSRFKATFQDVTAAVTGFFKRFRQPTPMLSEPQKHLSASERQKIRLDLEEKARQRAIWAIDNYQQNPDSYVAKLARDQAQQYLNRSAALAGKGPLQDWNRQKMAERWIDSDYSTETGQTAMSERMLQTFNANFGMDLTPEVYENTMKGIINSDTFQKALDINRNLYAVIFGMVGDEASAGTDARRIEQTLDLFNRSGVNTYEYFKDIAGLNSNLFNELAAESSELFNTLRYQTADDIERMDLWEGIVGRYVEF
jgi:hypothetical protein